VSICLRGLRLGHFLDGPEQAVSCVVDQHIEPAKMLDDGVDGAPISRTIGDVEFDRQ
jgi:hypothetical protein